MKKSSKYTLIVLVLLLLSFEATSLFFSPSKYSGNYESSEVEKIEKRMDRYGSALKDEPTYPFVFIFHDLMIILACALIIVVLLAERKNVVKEIKKMKKMSYKGFLILSITLTIVFLILLGLADYYSIKVGGEINEWSVYYFTHLLLMLSALFSSIFAFKVGQKRRIKNIDPRIMFFVLAVAYALQGLIIGLMDASFTRMSHIFGSILPAFILSYIILFFISLRLIYFIAASHSLKFNSFLKYASVFYVFVYSAGLWFFSWHLSIGQSIFRAYLQHPLPYRVWPFAVYWESWVDPWLMWMTLGFFVIYTAWMIKKMGKKD